MLREEVAYTFSKGDNEGGAPIGLLKTKAALVFNTSNTPEERERNIFSDPLEHIWKDCIFGFCGVYDFERKMFCTIAGSTLDLRRQWLEEMEKTVAKYFPAS